MDFVRALAVGVLRVLGCALFLMGLHALFSPRAHAAQYMDQGEAASMCANELSAALAAPNVTGPHNNPCANPIAAGWIGPTYWYSYTCSVIRGGTDSPCNVVTGSGHDGYFMYPSGATCAQRNSTLTTWPGGATVAGAVPECVAGCKMVYENLTTNRLGSIVVTSSYTDRQYIGDICNVPNAPTQEEQSDPRMTQPECKAAGGGQTFCVKPNGDHCHTTSNGKQICWRPQETGTKDDGVDAQSRTNDGTAIPPATPPSDGSTWTQTNQHTTTTTNNSTTTNYTVTNYTSGSSKPPKPIPNDDISEPGGGDEGNGTATPATDCAQTPQCSGGDAIGCAMLRQHHSMICREGSTTPSGLPDGDPESSVTEPVASLFQGDEGGSGPGLDLIDQDGWAGRGACPIALTIPNPFGGSFEMDESHLCMILDALAGLISLLAGIHGGWILLGGSRR